MILRKSKQGNDHLEMLNLLENYSNWGYNKHVINNLKASVAFVQLVSINSIDCFNFFIAADAEGKYYTR